MVHVCVICVQVSNYVSGWWLQPLWKTWVRQLAKHESQYTESHKIPWFQTTNQIYIVIPMINHYLTIINHRLTRKIPWFQSPPYIWNTHCITWISETTGPPKKTSGYGDSPRWNGGYMVIPEPKSWNDNGKWMENALKIDGTLVYKSSKSLCESIDV